MMHPQPLLYAVYGSFAESLNVVAYIVIIKGNSYEKNDNTLLYADRKGLVTPT